MRHRVTTKKLGRDVSHRKALVFNLSKSLIENKSVTTTLAKAKYVKPFVEKMVTRAKKGNNLANKRILLSRLNNRMELVDKLVNQIAKNYKNRSSGYLSIKRTKKRDGDKAMLSTISWVDVSVKSDEEPVAPSAKSLKKKKVSRTK